MGTKGTMAKKPVKIRASERNREKWRHICNEIDTDATYEEVVEMLYDYFEEDEDRYAAVKRAARGPEFR